MSAIKGNFAGNSVAKQLNELSLVNLLWMVLALFFICLFAWQTRKAYQSYVLQRNKVSDAQVRLNLVHTKNSLEKTKQLNSVISVEKATAVNQAIARLNVPWSDMLDALEASATNEIALLNIEPTVQTGSVKLMVEAKTTEDMFAFIQNLSRQTFFQKVLLTKHEINEQDSNKPVRFFLEASWYRSAAP